MKATDLARFRSLSDPQLHPDGDTVVFVVTQMDLDEDRYDRSLWIYDGDSARRLTTGPSDGRPRWSPDGASLAFLRKGDADTDRPQLMVMPMAGGEPIGVTDIALGVTEAEWSPDGGSLAVVGASWIEPLADLDDDERKRQPHRITRYPYRFDNAGWVNDRRSHIYLIDPNGEDEPVNLTPGDFDSGSISWHPSGDRIAFLSSRHDTREIDPGGEIFEVTLEGTATAVAPIGFWNGPSYAPDGELFVTGFADPMHWPSSPPLRRVSDLEVVTGAIDRSVDPHAPAVAPAGPRWLADGSAFIYVEHEGGVRIDRLDGTQMQTALEGNRAISGFSPRPDGSAAVFVAQSVTDPGELYWWEGGEERVLTTFNEEFRNDVTLVEPIRFTYGHDDEEVEIEGWIYLPDGDAPAPVLFNIHGGPASQYGWDFFDEFQVYVDAGYAVVAVNPRGSSGYGTDHVRAVVGRWQQEMPPDLKDLLAAVDAAAAIEPRLDTERLGIMGGSYGGLMTLWVTSADPRYKSAVAERGLYSWPSFVGTSDIGMWFAKMYIGNGEGVDYDTLWAASPLRHVDNVTTPTLVLHSETDFRTPIEQGEQLFAALRRNGVESEMLRFPSGEGHELSRGGKPKHRVERFEAILEWHGRYL